MYGCGTTGFTCRSKNYLLIDMALKEAVKDAENHA